MAQMPRILGAVFAGLLTGSAATYWLTTDGPATPGAPIEPLPVIERDIVEVPKMAMAEADAHREDRYERIRTIEDSLALPGDFAQTEALYVLAGRADSAEVQDLIDQANRIADPTDRNAAMSILFLRLAELDPRSALTMSRMRTYTSSRNLEAVIWRTWSKLDLDAAIAAAKAIRNPTERNLAAQTMLAAFGYTGNATTEKIEAELGVRANARARGQYLVSIADRSIAEAIDYINELPRSKRSEAVQWLASYLGQRDPSEALTYADLIQDAGLRQQYRAVVNGAVARLEPERILQNMPPGGASGPRSGQYHAAMYALAQTDVDKALMYYESMSSHRDKQVFASAIGSQLAQQDPARAIEWARAQDRSGQPQTLMSVIAQVASSDPALALAEADKITNLQWRQQMVSNVLSVVARDDPVQAIAYLDELGAGRDRELATQSIVNQWANQDPEAAINWLLASDQPNPGRLLSQAGYSLIANNVDAAIRVLPRIDEQTSAEWRTMITQTLATQRGAAEAQRFVDQYRDEPGYAQMQSALIGGVAQQDVYAARQIVDRLPAGSARDAGYSRLISQHLYGYPEEAASWLDSIADEQMRNQTAAQVFQQWYGLDSPAATRWIRAQPAGPTRDTAISRVAGNAAGTAREFDALLALVDDPSMRKQAQISRAWTTASSDPAAARRMLDDIDMSAEERRQMETQLEQIRR